MWRNDRKTFLSKCKDLVAKANSELPDGIVIPHPDTNPEEKKRQVRSICFFSSIVK